ncbi:MAG: isopentenyl-diphosphate Delta-isomerase [Sphingobacteriales bacterium]|nr:isopentenyl-diphosphate Delta-isomerase [Sphingobacteriales bacterium]OJW05264.1 MAG: isopentenyl-diphosphate delta-isomerase [Sphingobacteriales bacterium 44-61]
MEEQVILVNGQDEETGVAEKMEAHQQGWLHRAFSVFIFNSRGEMLLQQRALDKYHSGGLWTNTCCSHPRPGESTQVAAERRLKEEMGFQVSLEKVFDFVYKADFDNGLTEHEFDHVFAAEYEGPVNFNKEEVMGYSYRSMQQIAQSMETDPAQYTAWFRLAFPRVQSWWNRQYKTA